MIIMNVLQNRDGETVVQFHKDQKTVSLLTKSSRTGWVELACFTEGVAEMTRGPEVVSVEEALKIVSEL